MKKTLFAVIAVVTLLAFTGCDKILEFVFPDATGQGQGGGGQNFIKLEVLVDRGIADWFDHDVIGKISKANGDPIPNNIKRGSAVDYGDRISIVFSFDFIPDGQYRVEAWMEVNGQEGPQAEEAYATGQTPTGQDVITMPWDDPTTPSSDAATEVWLQANLWQTVVPTEGGLGVFFVGPDVVDVNTFSQTFLLDTLGGTAPFAGFHYSIQNSSSSEYDSGDVGNNQNWFDADFTSIVDVGTWYAVTSNVHLLDNGNPVAAPSPRGEFKVIQEPTSVSTYLFEIDGSGFNGPPHNLTGTYDVYVELKNWDRTSSYGTMAGTLAGGNFYIGSTDPIMYHTFAQFLDRALIYIDVNNDGNFYGTDDLAGQVEMALESWVISYYWFDIKADRFIPYTDFARIYMSGGGYYP